MTLEDVNKGAPRPCRRSHRWDRRQELRPEWARNRGPGRTRPRVGGGPRTGRAGPGAGSARGRRQTAGGPGARCPALHQGLARRAPEILGRTLPAGGAGRGASGRPRRRRPRPGPAGRGASRVRIRRGSIVSQGNAEGIHLFDTAIGRCGLSWTRRAWTSSRSTTSAWARPWPGCMAWTPPTAPAWHDSPSAGARTVPWPPGTCGTAWRPAACRQRAMSEFLGRGKRIARARVRER